MSSAFTAAPWLVSSEKLPTLVRSMTLPAASRMLYCAGAEAVWLKFTDCGLIRPYTRLGCEAVVPLPSV